MYVREKRIRRGDKTYSYWQLVESRWTENGPRQTVVAHLGAWPDKDTARVAAKMDGLMCGEDSCGCRGVARKNVIISYGFHKEEARALLCDEHARELGSGEKLTAVALRGE